MPTPKHVLIKRFLAAVSRTENGRKEWVEGMIDQALTLLEARDQFPNDDCSFGVWLAENGADQWGANDRAAMINLARGAQTRDDLVFIFDKGADDKWHPITLWRKLKKTYQLS